MNNHDLHRLFIHQYNHLCIMANSIDPRTIKQDKNASMQTTIFSLVMFTSKTPKSQWHPALERPEPCLLETPDRQDQQNPKIRHLP